MIKIYLNPEISGEPYINPATHDDIMMDTYVTNFESLVTLLESRCGLYYGVTASSRLTTYRKVMKDYISRNPECLMAASFKISELSTSRTCLMWRDALLNAGWNCDMNTESDRIQFIAEIEKSMSEHDKNVLITISDRVNAVISRLPQLEVWLEGGEMILPFNSEIMPPLHQRLINALKQFISVEVQQKAEAKDNNLGRVRDVLISNNNEKVSLSSEDDSFEIWRFRTEQEEMEYLTSLNINDFDLCINSDTKVMDSWLKMEGKPTVGSVIEDSNPQIAQLLTLGIGLFDYPLNISTMLQWLSAPKHPLDYELTSRLARKIRKTGGYHNEECQKVIEEYLEGIEDTKERKKMEKLIKMTLPEPSPKGVNIDELHDFVSMITQWANKSRIGALTNEKYAMDPLSLQQVENLYEQGNMLLEILQTEKGYVKYNVVEAWIKDIYAPSTYHQYSASKGCRMTISSPACIIDTPKKTLWANFILDGKAHLSTEFMHFSELEELRKQGCQFWEPENERTYNMEVMLMPFMMTQERLVLSCVDIKDGVTTEKHPLLIILEEKIKDIPHSTPTSQDTKVDKVDNSQCKDGDVVRFNNSGKLVWKDKESYSSLTNLIDHPMDYMFNVLLGINDGDKQDFKNVERTKGEVAHKVIELLFKPEANTESMEVAAIRGNIKNRFDEVFRESIEGYGAILQLLENETETKVFKSQLKNIVCQLTDLLADNNLKVKACEKEITTVFLEEENVNSHGFVDMIVVDSQNTPSVIDFKWSSSKTYQNYLKENRSLQLALYKYMVSVEEDRKVKYTGYFLMPEGKLFTHNELLGKHVVQIKPTEEDASRSVMDEIINSYRYRRAQMEKGEIELADNMSADNIQYMLDKTGSKLLPLSFYEDRKSDNRFSQIKTLTKNAK